MPVVAVVDPCVKCHIGAAATERLSLSSLSLILPLSSFTGAWAPEDG